MLTNSFIEQGDLNKDSVSESQIIPAEKARTAWAIGIYTGNSPLQLASPNGVENPVISYKDISDARAMFVADPFMVCEKGVWHMFFEIMNEESDKGEIGLAVSDDCLRWEYRRIVLRESFHLSYPYVFKWEDSYYMIPETLAASSVCLYKADPFPTAWSCIGTLVPERCADSSIFRFNEMWWMFVCAPVKKSDTLRLYSSAHLTGPWQEHPKSPIIEGDARIARPAGRVTLWDGKLIRFTQDCHARYGAQVRAFEITELTPTTYSEKEACSTPILFAANEGWNSHAMHHLDPHLTAAGDWIACVDGC